MRFRLARVAAGGFLLALTAFIAWRFATHNEDVVKPGELYRSAQLDPVALERNITGNGIKTVINLRGENRKSAWYAQEVALCDRLGVRHFDVRFSARHLPLPDEVDKLLQDYREAPRPILLHCRSGSDRTGLAASLYLIDQDHVPWKEAEQTLSWRYGHFAVYPYFEMDEFVQLYGQSMNKSLFDWTEQDYPSVYAEECKETRWDEMMEPFELFFTGRI